MKIRIFLTILILMMVLAGVRPGNICAEEGGSGWEGMVDLLSSENPEVVIIKLKNKGVINGVVLEKKEEGIIVDTGFGTIALRNRDIASIERPSKEEESMAVNEWKAHAFSTKRNIAKRKDTEEKVQERNAEYLNIQREIEKKAREEAEYKIKFDDSSRIEVKAVLNGKIKVPFIVDTGSSKVLISRDVAKKLFGDTRKFDRTVETTLADGSVRQGIPVILESIEAGGAVAENVPAIILELKGQPSLLGMSFLNNFHTRIDAENKILILKYKQP